MRLLLDSHIVLWYDKPGRLNAEVKAAIESADQVCVSAATVWELTYKQTVGKLSLPLPIRAVAVGYGLHLLNITPEHAELAGSLPLHHRDPFDRMLIAQAMAEDLTLVTHDRTLQQYGIPILLA